MLFVSSNFLHFFQGVLQDSVLSLELKIATKQLFLKQQRKPIDIVCPHVIERHLIQLKPLWTHFWWEKTKELCVRLSLVGFFLLPKLYLSTSSFPAASLPKGVLA